MMMIGVKQAEFVFVIIIQTFMPIDVFGKKIDKNANLGGIGNVCCLIARQFNDVQVGMVMFIEVIQEWFADIAADFNRYSVFF